MLKVTIGIKALNEEAHIGPTLTSAFDALQGLSGEVVLADSGSQDRTLEIAGAYPALRIVQLADWSQRCCGAGAQLAYQTARGEYFYLLDGDMSLDPGFLHRGIAFLDSHPDYAGVGGIVREMNTTSIEYQARKRNAEARDDAKAGDVDRLDCGGLYRRRAIEDLGYFADRNLHAFEEFELGARLRVAGWKLARIAVPAVDHHGHSEAGLSLLWRRLRNGYAGGTGEAVRAGIGHKHWQETILRFSHCRHAVIVIGWWLALAGLALMGKGWWWLACLLLPLAFLSWRRGSMRHGFYSLATWMMHGIGLIQGLIRPRKPPQMPLDLIVVQSGSP